MTPKARTRVMLNSTQASYFLLTAYFDPGPFKYLYFLIILCLYALIVCSNLLLIVVICTNRHLHEPMYMFLCSLFVNELFGSSALFPFLLLQILSDVHVVSAPFCFLQVFCVFSYVCAEFSNLTIMSYDRYVAICHPLQYNTRLTGRKVAALVALAWSFAFIAIAALISLVAPLQLCGNVVNKVYCFNYSIVKLACSSTDANNAYGLFLTFLVVFVPLTSILYTYVRIVRVCLSASGHTRQKAVSTCTPHLLSLLNFSFAVCFEIAQSRFESRGVSGVSQVVLSLYFLTCQPLFNSAMYGLKVSKIRVACRRLLLGSAVTRPSG